jgi:hypothetical protein
LYYYDNLAAPVRAAWWRPDFGSLITNPHAAAAQTVGVTDDDRAAYKDAMVAINNAVAKNSGNTVAEELLALGQVLEPDADKTIVQKGIDWFKSHGESATDEGLKLRYANNAGVGYQRLADLSTAYHTIIAAQKSTNRFNAALGENMGLVVVKGRSKEDDQLAASVMFTWLSGTPPNSPNWNTVKKTFEDVCANAGIEPKAIEQKPAYLCSVISLTTSGHDLGILLPTNYFKTVLGAPDTTTSFTEKYPDMTEMKWHGGKITAYTERNNVMRITTYEDGAFLLLRPVDATSQNDLKVKVGMTKAELFALINEKSGVAKNLANGGTTEDWTYFPSLNMGVLFDGDAVKAITVSPVIQG